MNSDESEHPETFARDALVGVMSCLEPLVICLRDSGHLDVDQYARLLAHNRLHYAAPGSVEEVLLDQILALLVDDPDVFLRRMKMKIHPVGSKEP
ncbi:hypothetical protein DKU74_20020 [Salmonella enterica subsp. salamae]|nr:hypothetical protein [Salmonella enterica subsp. enterica serovar Mikawasima]EAA9933504.1 hypothetical protein [Salmonella enterica subsp. salamae]EBX1374668.1 hypothetical protein [Salmonella enterica subsp. enterica serovar Newport]ECC8832770.1 hypothetical protein [Salmonella enterica subsp. salamae]EGX0284748.1 hypothetical protein [Salmonella enterica]